jgi:ABC-type nitrate/sulfonate/bicarbonate transport system substrate-binding protein
MLAHNHMTEQDVTAVDIGDDLTSLVEGKIDAQVAYLTDEPVALEIKGYPTVVFPGSENGFVTYAQVYFATEAFMAGHSAVVTTFLEVTNRGWREAFAHPKETAAMVVAVFMKRNGDVAYQERALAQVERVATQESPDLGSMRMATWKRSCEAFTLPSSLADELVDFSILRRLKQ